MQCTCPSAIRASESVTLIDRDGKTITVYHKACPVHGVTILAEVFRPYRREHHQRWFGSKAELREIASKEEVILLDVSADGTRGLVRWSEFVLIEEETETHV